MSGGSFNYLCHVQPEDLDNRIEDLESMSRALSDLGYEKIGQKIDDFIKELNKMNNKKQKFLDKYSDIMQAVEWFYSADSSFKNVEEEAKKLGF